VSYQQPASISVALCTFNGALYVEQQITSICNQSYESLEIVVVDDCSTDHTVELIRKLQLTDNRIKLYCNNVNVGYNANFSKALALCTGALIAISDQDDIWHPDKLSQMHASMYDNLLLYHDSEFVDEDNMPTGKSRLTTHRFVSGYCSRYLVFNNCVSGHTCLIRRELLTLVPPMPVGFYYDWWLAYTAACTGKINYLSEKLVRYRIHKNSVTQVQPEENRELRMRNLSNFESHPLTSIAEKEFLKALLLAYTESGNIRFSVRLFFLMLRNYGKLFYTRKRSTFSNLKFIVRECKR
jgi:glycosyltransferase involved in cell wall biosynthesis